MESWIDVEEHRREWRSWRPVSAIAIVLVIMTAAANDVAQPAWLLVGFIGPAALAGDEVTRRRRRAMHEMAVRAGEQPLRSHS